MMADQKQEDNVCAYILKDGTKCGMRTRRAYDIYGQNIYFCPPHKPQYTNEACRKCPCAKCGRKTSFKYQFKVKHIPIPENLRINPPEPKPLCALCTTILPVEFPSQLCEYIVMHHDGTRSQCPQKTFHEYNGRYFCFRHTPRNKRTPERVLHESEQAKKFHRMHYIPSVRVVKAQ